MEYDETSFLIQREWKVGSVLLSCSNIHQMYLARSPKRRQSRSKESSSRALCIKEEQKTQEIVGNDKREFCSMKSEFFPICATYSSRITLSRNYWYRI